MSHSPGTSKLPPPRVPLWGLTGGIASGKSLAAKEFERLGIPVVDADQIARSLTQPGGRAADAILQEFGTLNRAELRDRVFSDAAKRKRIEEILHPLIGEESRKKIAQVSCTNPAPPAVVYEAALLIEAGRAKEFETLIVVTAPREIRILRLMARGDLTHQQALQMVEAQLPEAERLKWATHVLTNEGSPAELYAQVAELMRELQKADSSLR